jgi:hypothetical protein
MPTIDDPEWGQSRPDREWPKRCSWCHVAIKDGDSPLMVWGNKQPDGHMPMWVYCQKCEEKEKMWELLERNRRQRH